MLIGSKHSRAVVRQEHRYQPSRYHDGGGGNDAQVQYAHQSVQFLCTVVVAGDRLHSLVYTEYEHDEHHRNTIGYSVGSHGEVASEPHQLVVDEDDDDAGAHVHQKRRNADGKDIVHEFLLQFVDAFLEVEQFVLVAEEFELPAQCHQLRKDGGDGGSLYSPFEDEDEERIEYHVHHHREDGGKHGLLGFTCRSEQGVHAEIHVAHHIAQQDDNHILMGIDECLVAGSEEDYWAFAAEYADSCGVDVINSSLGYHGFDDASTNHHYNEQDGNSTLISRTASMCADKGIICVNSAGNDGMGSWKKINFPADARNILTVGSVNEMGENAAFSAVGPTADGRIKPDVMAYGSPTCVITGRGNIINDNGTSFSSPLIAGMVACLWQALPQKTAKQIMKLVRLAGNNQQHPDNVFGYGVPDFWKAYQTGKAIK